MTAIIHPYENVNTHITARGFSRNKMTDDENIVEMSSTNDSHIACHAQSPYSDNWRKRNNEKDLTVTRKVAKHTKESTMMCI